MRYVIDIETLGLDPFSHKVIGIGVMNLDSGEIEVKFSKNEEELLNLFWSKFLQAHTIIGHNIMGFDIPFVVIRSIKHGIAVPTRFPKVVDTLNVFSMNDNKKRRRLSTIANFLGFEVKDRDASQIPTLWDEGRVEELEEYLKKDLEMTANIFKKLEESNVFELYDWLKGR